MLEDNSIMMFPQHHKAAPSCVCHVHLNEDGFIYVKNFLIIFSTNMHLQLTNQQPFEIIISVFHLNRMLTKSMYLFESDL